MASIIVDLLFSGLQALAEHITQAIHIIIFQGQSLQALNHNHPPREIQVIGYLQILIAPGQSVVSLWRRRVV